MKISAYCRVSTDKDEQLKSFEAQKDFFADYAQKNGHELVEIYADEGLSGTSTKKRYRVRIRF
jgi:DNA invertase Pin-like site-specific DNA recombinase